MKLGVRRSMLSIQVIAQECLPTTACVGAPALVPQTNVPLRVCCSPGGPRGRGVSGSHTAVFAFCDLQVGALSSSPWTLGWSGSGGGARLTRAVRWQTLPSQSRSRGATGLRSSSPACNRAKPRGCLPAKGPELATSLRTDRDRHASPHGLLERMGSSWPATSR